ncbi:hypothetical protein EV127DRAFT_452356 [Xylaria flabelliformis]|nr:hypothetical protein EV127DRAFT_452356 [Xylaria flabelliformis]
MALTVKQLNSDASFLLSFEPVIPEAIADSVIPRPFTILLDPWITGPSTIFHPRISITSHKHPACISSLAELSQPPDLVIISQHKPDHCNEATLRQLSARGETLILAEPASARIIKSWKYFDKEKIRIIEQWEDPRITGRQSVIRVPVPSFQLGGQEGEVTVAFIPQKHDLAGLHIAIGITYRPPPTHDLIKQVKFLTPPLTPESYIQHFTDVGEHHSRPISLIFSPHGIQYSCIAPYATSHLVAEAALPLTALLHCMDSISNPWWLGGNICAGVPYGAEIASKLGARLWISAHDGEKDVRGLATGLLKIRRWKDEDIRGVLENGFDGPPNGQKGGDINVQEKPRSPRRGGCTEILRLDSGEEILVSGTGRAGRHVAQEDGHLQGS